MKIKKYIILFLFAIYLLGVIINNELINSVLYLLIISYTFIIITTDLIKLKFHISYNTGKWGGFIFFLVFTIISWVNKSGAFFIFRQLAFISIVILLNEFLSILLKTDDKIIYKNKSNFLFENRVYNKIIIGLFFLIVGIAVLMSSLNNSFQINYETVALLLFITFPFFDNRFYSILNKFLLKVFEEKEIFIKAKSLQKLAKIKTIAFDKKGVVTDGDYFLSTVNYRKTIQKTTILKLFYSIGKLWKNTTYCDLKMQNVEEVTDLILIENTDNKITVKDKSGNSYTLSNESKKSTDLTHDYNLFLYKNDLQIAKLLVLDKVFNYSKKLLNELNKQGFNTVLFCSYNEKLCSKTVKKTAFDKIYENTDYEKKVDLLSKLQAKAPVMYVTNEINSNSEVELKCLLNSKNKFNGDNIDIFVKEPLNLPALFNFWNKILKFLFHVNIVVILYHLLFYYLIIGNILPFNLLLVFAVIFSLSIFKIYNLRLTRFIHTKTKRIV